jgi:hypothetical protein
MYLPAFTAESLHLSETLYHVAMSLAKDHRVDRVATAVAPDHGPTIVAARHDALHPIDNCSGKEKAFLLYTRVFEG